MHNFHIDMIRRALSRINDHLDTISSDIDEESVIRPWKFFEIGRELQFIDEVIQEAFLTKQITTNSYNLLNKWFVKYNRALEDIINQWCFISII